MTTFGVLTQAREKRISGGQPCPQSKGWHPQILGGPPTYAKTV